MYRADTSAQDRRAAARERLFTSTGPSGLMWGVGAVSLRLGIATPTLRTWERRYGLGPSQRTEGGHRRYSEQDISRVQLMGHLVAQGVSAHAAAKVAVSLDAAAVAAALRDDTVPASGDRFEEFLAVPAVMVAALVAGADDMDVPAISRTTADAIARWGVVGAWSAVLVPALRQIGDRWAAGTLGVEAEHLVTELVHAELRAVVRSAAPRQTGGRPVVLASAEDEQHSLPVLAVEAALAADGMACYALGARMPAAALTEMVRRVRPAVVFVWATMPQSQVQPRWMTMAQADEPATVLLGGPGWPSDTIVPATAAVERCDDLAGTLDRIRAIARDVDPAPAG